MNLNSYKKILIVRLSSLGDILLSTPLIRTLKNQFPHLQIDFLIRKEFKDTLINNIYLDKLYLLERNLNSSIQIKAQIKAAKYDLIIDLQNNFRSASIISSSICKKLKFKKRNFEKFLLVKFKINKLKNFPSIPIRYAETISNLQLDNDGLDLFLSPAITSQLTDKKNYIGFCPNAKHYTKRWINSYFVDLGNKLSKIGFTIVLFGGVDDEKLCKDISSKIESSICLSSKNDLQQIAKDMQQCKLIVCNDSGLMHTACAVYVPVVAIFGSTVKEFGFTPYKNKNLLLENYSLSCRPCSHIGKSHCPKKHFKCMNEITPEIVYNNLVNFLQV